MKIACDACAAKYTIADDKVRGKAFKIRCKKCSNIIVVRGVTEDVAEPAPAPDAIWHVVIDGNQLGPLAMAELETKVAEHAIDSDTFAWREGQADWQPLSQIPELAALVTPQAPALDVLAAREHVQRMTAERNESSVLFSLHNLQHIATRSPARAAPASQPGQEGSGLIDIRSMASAYLGAPGAAATPATGSVEELPVFATSVTFSEPALLVPAAAPRSDRKVLYVVIAAAAGFAAIALVLLVLVLKQSSTIAPTPPVPPVQEVTAAVVAPAAIEAPPPASPPPAAPVAAPTPAPAPRPRPQHVDVPKPLQPAKPAADTCDEVHCLVDASAPCCQRVADQLTKAMIQHTMAAVKPKVLACGTSAHGRAHVKIHVAPTGRVDEADVDQSVSAAVDACIERTIKAAVFPATKTGGGFGVPYDL